MKNYKLSRLNLRAAFGKVESVENDMTGDYDEEFVPKVTLWAGDVTNTIAQQLTNLGTDRTTTRVIAVRHGNPITDKLLVQIGNDVYSITEINTDDSSVNSFDVISLKLKDGK